MTEELRRVLWPKGHRPDIWAVVDAAQDQQVYWTLTNSFLPHSCLFAGPLPQALEMAAPYLVQLDPEDKFTNYLAKNLDRNLGIFLRCDTSLGELRRHLRTFLRVKDVTGRKLLFRYYDPRILRAYLPTCSMNELQTVFGPIKTFWTISGEGPSMKEFEIKGKQLLMTPQPLGTRVEATADESLPVIVPAQNVIPIPKGAGSRHRVPILLQGAGKGGTLRSSSNALRIYRTVAAKDELAAVDGVYTIPPANLDPDVTVYAEAAAPGEVQLTLEPSRGGKAEFTVTTVELTLDGGPGNVCVGLPGAPRRRISVPPPAPATFKGRLTLRTSPGAPPLTLFESATGALGYPLAEGYAFDAPATPVSFWLEGNAASQHTGDAAVHLFLEDNNIAGATLPVTVIAVEAIQAEIPVAPPKSQRLPAAGPAADTVSTRSLVLLAGAAEEASPIQLTAAVKPATVALNWTVTRAEDDAPAILELSPNALPTLHATGDGATLLSDAAGTFRVRASAGEQGWGGPMAEMELVLVHAALAANKSTVNGRFCACARAAGSDQFRLHSGNDPAVRLEGRVELTGGGPEGKRGLDSISGGWVNNIVSDNSGARYKGGNTLRSPYRYGEGEAAAEVDFDDGPILDAPAGARCVSESAPAGPLNARPGTAVSIQAHLSPASSWPVSEPGALDRTIEQIWRYLDCRSFLTLWSEDAPGQLGVLLETGWSFTGDYSCTATRTTRSVVPARLAATGTVTFPALVPAVRTGIEVHPPASGRGSSGGPGSN